MKFGISLPPFGDFANPLFLAETAELAENAGWDGFFLWDQIVFDGVFHPITDPWIALTAVALRTSRMRLGTLITPLARRRPWIVARQTAALDLVSEGRLILGVGLGEPASWEFGVLGEETDPKIRAGKLDESLDILSGLWGSEPFSYHGSHYHLDNVQFLPRPVQQPRIPVWVGGWWPHKRPMRRAARWDGVFPIKDEGITPAEWHEIMALFQAERQSAEPFDFIHAGNSTGDNPDKARLEVEPYRDAGVTWWMEGIEPWRFGMKPGAPWSSEATARMQERIVQGPPRI